MLNCREISERASDYLDRNLPWRVRMQVRLHLLMCRFCREYIRQLALVVRTLPLLPRESPDQEMQQAMLTIFRSERQ